MGRLVLRKPDATVWMVILRGICHISRIEKQVKEKKYFKMENQSNTPIYDQISNYPDNGKLIAYYEVSDQTKVESFMHKIFHQQREQGEWFRLSSDDVNFIIDEITDCSIIEQIAKIHTTIKEGEYNNDT